MSGITHWDILFGFPAVFVIFLLASSIFLFASSILFVLFENVLVWYVIVLGSFYYLFWRFS